MRVLRVTRLLPRGVLAIQVDQLAADMSGLREVVEEACEHDVLFGAKAVDRKVLFKGKHYVVYFPACCPSGTPYAQMVVGDGRTVGVLGFEDIESKCKGAFCPGRDYAEGSN